MTEFALTLNMKERSLILEALDDRCNRVCGGGDDCEERMTCEYRAMYTKIYGLLGGVDMGDRSTQNGWELWEVHYPLVDSDWYAVRADAHMTPEQVLELFLEKYGDEDCVEDRDR